MNSQKRPNTRGLARWAKSYSIVDHQLLHGGYLQKLSPFALALYLFLVVVGDREGKSFYGESSILQILRFAPDRFQAALDELINSHLIEYRRPYFWVKNVEPSCRKNKISAAKKEKPQGRKQELKKVESIQSILQHLLEPHS